MIFITVGSQKFQFNRLLKEVDRLIEENKIKEEVFAQSGYSDYIPKNYSYKNFLDRDEFSDAMKRSDKVITHAGTGAIVGAIKQGKKVFAIPRLKEFGEHVDDHQLQIVEQFEKLGFITAIYNLKMLEIEINNMSDVKPIQYISNTENIIFSINKMIENIK